MHGRRTALRYSPSTPSPPRRSPPTSAADGTRRCTGGGGGAALCSPRMRAVLPGLLLRPNTGCADGGEPRMVTCEHTPSRRVSSRFARQSKPNHLHEPP